MLHFLFKPSLSWAQSAQIAVCGILAWNGHWLAWAIFGIVSAAVGATIETLVMESAQPTGDLG